MIMETIKGRPYPGNVRGDRYETCILEEPIGETTHLVEDTLMKGCVCLCFNAQDAELIAYLLNEDTE